MMCRVRRKHVSPDFDWVSVFQGSGGLNGLLYTLRTGTPPDQVVTGVPSDQVGTGGGVANQPSNSVAIGSAAAPSETTKELDPIALFEKAKDAVVFAGQVLTKAEKFSNAQVRLSEEFVKQTFPIDPEDDHYNYCILCGLIGDVICCEGCPNVVHPRCINLEDIPDEDWYCSRCQREGKVPPVDSMKGGENDSSDARKQSTIVVACEGADVLPESMAAPDGLDDDADRLEGMLSELKSLRPIRPKKPKKTPSKEQKDEDSDKEKDEESDEEKDDDGDEDNRPSSPGVTLRRSSRGARRTDSPDVEGGDDHGGGRDSDHDVRAPPARIRVGMRVKKKFGGSYFYGTVLVRDPVLPLFQRFNE
jgi:hypothetical protein